MTLATMQYIISLLIILPFSFGAVCALAMPFEGKRDENFYAGVLAGYFLATGVSLFHILVLL